MSIFTFVVPCPLPPFIDIVLTTFVFREFDAVVTNFQTLSTTVLRTLHLELRTLTVHSLQTIVKQTYVLDTLLNDPDPAIVSLNTTLVSFDTEISTYLPPSQHEMIANGLAGLMDTHLLHLSSKIGNMNPNGAKLMQLNILVLQQNLKNIEPSAQLPSSALFFDMFLAGPQEIVRRAKQEGKRFGGGNGVFGYEVVKGLVELSYGERLRDERREVGVQARRQLDSDLLEISEAMY